MERWNREQWTLNTKGYSENSLCVSVVYYVGFFCVNIGESLCNAAEMTDTFCKCEENRVNAAKLLCAPVRLTLSVTKSQSYHSFFLHCRGGGGHVIFLYICKSNIFIFVCVSQLSGYKMEDVVVTVHF